jgi:hypothetical protein
LITIVGQYVKTLSTFEKTKVPGVFSKVRIEISKVRIGFSEVRKIIKEQELWHAVNFKNITLGFVIRHSRANFADENAVGQFVACTLVVQEESPGNIGQSAS